jgi:hypothetical protein
LNSKAKRCEIAETYLAMRATKYKIWLHLIGGAEYVLPRQAKVLLAAVQTLGFGESRLLYRLY